MKNACITVAGHDHVGIIAKITQILSRYSVNIQDISQTVMSQHFTMVILVDLSECTIHLDDLKAILKELGEKLGLTIRVQLR